MALKEQVTPQVASPLNQLIGTGIAFPFSFSAQGRSQQVEIGSGPNKINQAIHTLLSTYKGEKLFFPNYGSNLPRLVFEPEDDILYDQLYIETVDALKTWEPRIEVVAVYILASNVMTKVFYAAESTVGIQINYTILRTHQNNSYVFPFKLGALPLLQG